MSQWGAYGYAQHGWGYARILAHYYPGTTLGPAAPRAVRVLLVSAKKATRELDRALERHRRDRPARDARAGSARAQGRAGARRAAGAAAAAHLRRGPAALGRRRAYRGKLVVSGDGKLVQVVNVVGLEQYLKGVVPRRCRRTGRPRRSRRRRSRRAPTRSRTSPKGRPFDLYGDTRSQVYGGVEVESPSTSAAVDATRGQVVLYNGKVADTLFFSTSGGRTASALESTGIAVPYLVSVADPYDTLSPYHDWGPVVLDAAKVAKALKLSAPIADLQLDDRAVGPRAVGDASSPTTTRR